MLTIHGANQFSFLMLAFGFFSMGVLLTVFPKFFLPFAKFSARSTDIRFFGFGFILLSVIISALSFFANFQ